VGALPAKIKAICSREELFPPAANRERAVPEIFVLFAIKVYVPYEKEAAESHPDPV